MATQGTEQIRAALGIGGLFEVVPDAVIVGDATTGTVVLWNHAAEAIFGYPPEQAYGMPLDTLVPAELKAAHLAGLAGYAQHGSERSPMSKTIR